MRKLIIFFLCVIVVTAGTLPAAASNVHDGDYTIITDDDDDILADMDPLVPGIESVAQVAVVNNNPQIREYYLIAEDAYPADFYATQDQSRDELERISDELLAAVDMEVWFYPTNLAGQVVKHQGSMIYHGPANGHQGNPGADTVTDSLTREPIYLYRLRPRMAGVFVITLNAPENEKVLPQERFEYSQAKFRWKITGEMMGVGPVIRPPEPGGPGPRDPNPSSPGIYPRETTASSVDASDIQVLDYSDILVDEIPEHMLPQTGGGRIFSTVGNLAPILVFILIALFGLLLMKVLETRKKSQKK